MNKYVKIGLWVLVGFFALQVLGKQQAASAAASPVNGLGGLLNTLFAGVTTAAAASSSVGNGGVNYIAPITQNGLSASATAGGTPVWMDPTGMGPNGQDYSLGI